MDIQQNANDDSSNDNMPTLKLLVLGDSNVGKTCMIHRYCDRAFYSTYISTIGIDCKQKVVTIDDARIKLRIWDTAGQERFRTLTTAYYRGAQGILLVYDITNDNSFNHLSYWLKNIVEMASPDICRVLVGNKSDLDDGRAVDTAKGKKLAQAHGVNFFETSCKTGHMVDEAFEDVARQIKAVMEKKGIEKQLILERQPSWNKQPFKKQSWCGC